VGVGHSHVVALVQGGSSFDLALQFNELLNCNSNSNSNNSGENALFADVHVTWPGGGHGKKDRVLSMHRALLHARCPRLLTELLPTKAGPVPLVLLPCPATLIHVRLDAMQVLLEYIYKDTVDWRATHRGRRLLPDDVMWLAQHFQLPRLSSMCAVRASKTTTSFVASGRLIVSGNRGALLREITKKAARIVLKDAHSRRPTKRKRPRVASGRGGTSGSSSRIGGSGGQHSTEPKMAPPPPPPSTTGETKTAAKIAESTVPVSTNVPASTYQQEMLHLLHSATHFDIKLSSHGMKEMNEEPVPCHRAILCRYPFFRALLTGQWKESQSDVVMLGEHMSRTSLQTVLEFVYTANKQCVKPGNVQELLHCSAIFGMNDLKNISERYISERLDVDNASDCLDFAAMLGLERLSREAMDMIEFGGKNNNNTSTDCKLESSV